MSYAPESETDALIKLDTRTPAQKKLDKMFDERWGNEQGAEPAQILYQIALELIEKDMK